ncbi:MAG: thiol reductant ABC exporter subunit CydC [Deltaproteobacteria bacterium]|nr:thiol reductant ABC exporter subunit CydC [Deltaproteobacteria bacterium]TLN04094.1 MAG: thiol reductant ABC exporter subunit CydC [bacterium]
MSTLMTVLRICRAQWHWLAGGILLGLLVIAANVFLMALSGWFIASMAVAGSTGLSFNYQLPAAGIRALAIIRTLGRYAERLITHEAALRVLADLRVWFFRRLTPLAPAGLERYAAGDLAGRLRADVDALENLYLRIIAPLATGLLSMCCGVAIVALWSRSVAGVLLGALATTGLLLPLVVRHLAKQPGEASAALSGDLRIALTESIEGYEELQILGAADRQTEELTRLSARLVAAQQQLARITAIGQAGGIAGAGIALAAVLALAGSQVADDSLPGPTLVMLLLLSAALFETTALLPAALQTAPATIASLRRILQAAMMRPPIGDPANPRPCPVLPLPVSFHDVRAIYLPEYTARQQFSLNVAAGERVALIGPSGAGKSTIMELLLRFRPYTGTILIGDAELRDIADETLRQLVTALPQAPHLFNATIRDNILIAHPEASADELSAAISDAGLSEWIAKLPEGLATQVGEQGHLVSGGEARRIALARTLLKDTPIVLLDEPTEGLDAALERQVVARLAERLAGKTVLLATHRRACLALADRVVTLEECCGESS